MNINDIPIFINAYNRLGCMQNLIRFLENTIPNKIYILDNQSTYPPLLEYYKSIKHEVVTLDRNYGHNALWLSRYINNFKGQYYVLTDPDVVPIEECPANFLEHFYDLLQRITLYKKVGFSLKIDDIPNYYPDKYKVLDWEAQFWKDKISDIGFKAPIDTTFALYHPTTMFSWQISIRTAYPYIARHTTWYLDPNNMPEDELYYSNNNTTTTHWSKSL